jgi:4-carboxymuconolactone decarboxylase
MDGQFSGVSRRNRGISAFARQFAVPEEEVSVVLAGIVGPTLSEEALQAAGGAAWWHPALSARDRSVAVISALVSQGGVEARLRSHVRLALREGLTEDALVALIALLAVYVGFPRASVAIELIREECAATAESASRNVVP